MRSSAALLAIFATWEAILAGAVLAGGEWFPAACIALLAIANLVMFVDEVHS